MLLSMSEVDSMVLIGLVCAPFSFISIELLSPYSHYSETILLNSFKLRCTVKLRLKRISPSLVHKNGFLYLKMLTKYHRGWLTDSALLLNQVPSKPLQSLKALI